MACKFLPLFAVLAIFALVVSSADLEQREAGQQQQQAAPESGDGSQGNNLASILQFDLKEIANQAQDAIEQVVRGTQKSQIGQALTSQLKEIARQAEENIKQLRDDVTSASRGLSAQNLRQSPLAKAMIQDLSTINELVANAAKQAAKTESGAKIGSDLQLIVDRTRDAFNNLNDPQLKDAVTKGFDQISAQAQKVLDEVAQIPAAQEIHRTLENFGDLGRKGLNQLSTQIKSGALEKDVQSFWDRFSNYAKGAGEQLNNLETVKLAREATKNSLGRQGGVASTATQTEQA